MKKPEETKGEAIPVPTWAKIAVLVGLVFILILGLILPVKVVPEGLALLSNTISSVFIPREKTEVATTTQVVQMTQTTTDTATSTPTETVTPPTVVNEPTPAVVTPTPKPVAPRVTTPYGLPDLQVKIISTGFLTGNSTFVPSSIIYADQQAAVKFQIINVGTNNTGAWGFSAELPSLTDANYNSPLQQNLRPGDKIEYTLGFYNPTNVQNHLGAITANPSNSIAESSKENNRAIVFFPITNTTLKPVVGPTYSTTTTVVNPITGGSPDLSVKILETGTVNRATNQFTKTNSVNASDKVGVRIEVDNLGGNFTGPWKFQASLPTTSSTTNFTSDSQASLAPGEKAILLLSFDNIQAQGNNYFTINIDPLHMINESDKTNNSATVNIVRQ